MWISRSTRFLPSLVCSRQRPIERALHQILERFQPCTMFLTIYAAVHQDGEYPSIRLNPYFLQDACRLSASVDIIVDNDYVPAEPDGGNHAER